MRLNLVEAALKGAMVDASTLAQLMDSALKTLSQERDATREYRMCTQEKMEFIASLEQSTFRAQHGLDYWSNYSSELVSRAHKLNDRVLAAISKSNLSVSKEPLL